MPAASNIKSQKRRLYKMLSKFLELYNNKIANVIENEEVTVEELNKISAAVLKNIPDLLKLHESLEYSLNQIEKSSTKFDIISKMQNDEITNSLIAQLLTRISLNTENL